MHGQHGFVSASAAITQMPMIFLTSKGDEIDEVSGLRMGADDYVKKPFSQRLSGERIRALLRHQEVGDGDAGRVAIGDTKEMKWGELRIYPLRHSPLAPRIITFNLIALVFLAAGLLYLNDSRKQRVQQTAHNLVWDAQLVSNVFETQASSGATALDVRNTLSGFSLPESGEVFVYDGTGILIGRTLGASAVIELLKLLNNIDQYLSEEARSKGIDYITDLPSTSIVVNGLESRLAQVFVNPITDAISFCEDKNAIRVWARRRGNCVPVVVEDSGSGIPNQSSAKIFKRFYSERPEVHFGSNSGPGLAISKQIVEAHGCVNRDENIRPPEADITSDPLGARFVVGLPV